jgi:hypothetical protein
MPAFSAVADHPNGYDAHDEQAGGVMKSEPCSLRDADRALTRSD